MGKSTVTGESTGSALYFSKWSPEAVEHPPFTDDIVRLTPFEGISELAMFDFSVTSAWLLLEPICFCR